MQATSTVTLLDALLNRLGGEVISALHASGFEDARPGHGLVMGHLGGADGMRLVDLAQRAGVTPQAMGQLVDRLEALGYVERRPDPSDRRAKLIHLAERGRAGGVVAGAAVRRQEKRLRAVLGDAGYERFRRALEKLVAAGSD